MTHLKPLLLVASMLVAGVSLYAQQKDNTAPVMYTSLDGNLVPVAASEDYSNDTIATDTVKGVHPLYDSTPVSPEISNWSLYLALGGNLFDGDFTSEKKHAFFLPTAGIGAAYHFNNTWALGLDYKFRLYRVFGADGHAKTLLNGRTHQASGYLTFDIFNCFRPQNKHKLFSLDLILGAGAFWYKNWTYYPNVYKANLYNDFVYQQHTKEQAAEESAKYRVFGMFIGGASFEFNLNRSIQLGARVLYNYATTDLVDGRVRGNNNDGILDMEFLLRYKIDAVHKSHTRNFRSKEALEEMIAAGEPQQPEKRDTVYLGHPKDTVYISSRDTLYVINRHSPGMGRLTGTIPGGYDDSDIIPNAHYYYVVYFDNDDPSLDNMAKSIVQEAAQRMQTDREVKALIIGSCDNTGAVEYNKWLAVTRAYNVAHEMTEGYGVTENRIYTVGRGIMIDNRPEGSYRPNRRVEIHLLKQIEYEQAIQVYKEFESNKSVKRGSAVRQKDETPTAQTNMVIKVPNDLNVADGDQITVRHNTTLQRLAQKYYNNTNCWVYIYLANGERVAIPDQVVEGTSITLPLLTDKQRQVTVDEVKELLGKYVNMK